MVATGKPAYAERIVRDPNIMVGKPTVRGTRIPVELVLEQLSYNLDLKELLAAYPRLTEDDVKACLSFAQKAVRNKKARPGATKDPAGAQRAAV